MKVLKKRQEHNSLNNDNESDGSADIHSMINTFENIINNPLSQHILHFSTEYCEKCHANRLESTLDYYLGKSNHLCFKDRLVLPFVKLIIKKGLSSFHTSEESFKKAMQDPYWERGLISVFKGMADFGVGRPFVPGAPFQIVWNITKSCNMRCLHCYENAGKKDSDELSSNEIIKGIDKLADLGVASIAFSGGEPTIHPDIIKFLRHASDKGMYVSLATNGFKTADMDFVNKLNETDLKFVQISLDGLNPKTHDDFRNTPNSWERAVQSIKNFNKTGIFVEVATTVTKNNIDEIPDMIPFLRDLGVGWFMLYNFIPTGSGSEVEDIDLSPSERFNLLNMIYDENKKGDMQILSTAPQFADIATSSFSEDNLIPTHFYNPEYTNPAMKELSEFVGGCGAGRFYMSIEPNGEIFPCVFFPHDKQLKLGNINDDLEAIWKNNNLLCNLRNKDILKGHCGKCESKYICGGCRARAYNYFGDVLEVDPGCRKNEDYAKIK